MDKSNIIFDLTRQDWNYKGILFAEMDNNVIFGDMPPYMKPLKDYVIGVMSIIWTDEKGIWRQKTRLKFPSGNKQVFEKDYGQVCNETKVLTDIYRLGLINKTWYPNKDGTCEGILRTLEESDMIESMRVVGK